eukprot:Filipodium_phascolosomae@DN8045_c0_g1_i2.p1
MSTLKGRCYTNNFSDYVSSGAKSNLIEPDGRLKPPIRAELENLLDRYCTKILRYIPPNEFHDDTSLYTGSAGIAYMFIRKSTCCENDRASSLKIAEDYLSCAKKNRRSSEKHTTSLMGGTVGELLCETLLEVEKCRLSPKTADWRVPQKVAENYLKHTTQAVQDNDSDEWLYGRAGYLYGALLLKRLFQNERGVRLDPKEDVRLIVKTMMRSGHSLSEYLNKYHEGLEYPSLMYQWHKTFYFGAAHGLVGIYYMLLEANESYPGILRVDEVAEIHNCIDMIRKQKRSNGNYPSAVGESNDHLLHFCHGGPGMLLLLLRHLALTKQKDVAASLMNEALAVGDLIWKYGLLKKGLGICHGIAGSGYTFLVLFAATKDFKWLHRATSFAYFLVNFVPESPPDRPYSLFEGLSGSTYFLLDLLYCPQQPVFPLFMLPHQ